MMHFDEDVWSSQSQHHYVGVFTQVTQKWKEFFFYCVTIVKAVRRLCYALVPCIETWRTKPVGHFLLQYTSMTSR